MADIQLSPHFYLSEFTASQTAARMGRPVECVAGDGIFEAIANLAVNILEPVHLQFGTVKVSSGYRPAWLNGSLPGTAKTSQHMKGEAADFTCPGHSVEEVTRWISQSGLPFDQLIYEFGAWTHCSFTTAQTARGQVLTAQHGGEGQPTIYLQGIVV